MGLKRFRDSSKVERPARKAGGWIADSISVLGANIPR